MSSYTRAVSILRTVSVILTEQLAGVDLFALREEARRATAAGQNEKISLESAKVWRYLLAAVGPALAEFGRELRLVQIYNERRRIAIMRTQVVVWVIESAVVLLAVFTMFEILHGHASQGDLAGLAVSFGVIISLVFLMLGVFAAWSTMLNESFRKVRAQEESPLLAELLRLGKALSGRFIVLLIGAVTSGANVQQQIQIYHQADENARKLWTNRDCARAAVDAPGECRLAGVDQCTPEDFYTMENMLNVIQRYCPYLYVDIADKLIEIKLQGVDRFDRGALWTDVSAGVGAVRSLTFAAYDDGRRPTPVTRDLLIQAVRDEVVPLLCLPGVELAGWKKADDATFGAPHRDGVSVIDKDGEVTTAQCQRGCFDADGETTPVLCFSDGRKSCVSGYADTRRVRFEDAYTDLASRFVPSTPADSATTGMLVLMRPPDFVFGHTNKNNNKNGSGSADSNVSSASTAKKAYDAVVAAVSSNGGKPTSTTANDAMTKLPDTAAAAYEAALARPGAAAATLQRQATEVAKRLFRVAKRNRFVLDLDTMRAYIDRGLSEYYGAAVYGTPDMAAAVSSVIRRVNAAVKQYRRAGPQMYIDPERLREKMLAMSGDEVSQLQETMAALRAACSNFNKLFPSYRSTAMRKLATIGMSIGGLLLMTMLIVYLIIVWTMFYNNKLISRSSFNMRIVVSVCFFIIVIFVIEVVFKKSVSRIEHNQTVNDDNGTLLLGAAVRTDEQFAEVCATLGMGPQVVAGAQELPGARVRPAANSRAQLAALLADCRGVVEKYEVCNSITDGQSEMPMPLSDSAIYLTIACIFAAVAVICIVEVDPMARVEAIRSLSQLGRSIKVGSPTALLEAQTTIECARPSQGSWKFFLWFGVLVLVTITAWFATGSMDAVFEYENNLQQRQDCA